MEWCDRTLVSSPYSYGICFTLEDYRATLKANGVQEIEYADCGLGGAKGNAQVSFYKCPGGQRLAIVTLGKGHEKLRLTVIHGLLVHEGTHIWQAILEEQGDSEPSSEYEAYSLQSITQNLMEQYEAWTIASKKKANSNVP